MKETRLTLLSIGELSGIKFTIPYYQRGYRWTEYEVNELLDDVYAFKTREGEDLRDNDYYCLQTLVVNKKEQETMELIKQANTIDEVESLLKGCWDVIDGQQRLTTSLLILDYLQHKEPFFNLYSIDYESDRELKMQSPDEKGTLDSYHVYHAKQCITNWFNAHNDINQDDFKSFYVNHVKFIWYVTDEENPIKVFTRLNIGKIGLTNSELVKALFLNEDNFKRSQESTACFSQQDIALEWDEMERMLQKDEFWFFLNRNKSEKPTRIDFLFDLIFERDELSLADYPDFKQRYSKDDKKVFKYFYKYFTDNKENIDILTIWNCVRRIYYTFLEWYNDIRLYHYIGYILTCKQMGYANFSQFDSLNDLLNKWRDISNTKENFLNAMRNSIYDVVKGRLADNEDVDGLKYVYEIDNATSKTECRALLLLHNVATIINQQDNYMKNAKYGLPVFYKFPFHLFKAETWNVEHIEANTPNDDNDKRAQQQYLLSVGSVLPDDDIKNDIIAYLCGDKGCKSYTEIIQSLPLNSSNLDERERNMWWNFCLLDEHTNKSYHNDVFSLKRQKVIGRDSGKEIEVVFDPKERTIKISKEKEATNAFFPPCTLHVFMKYYTASPNDLTKWSKEDAKEYQKDVVEQINREFAPNTNN